MSGCARSSGVSRFQTIYPKQISPKKCRKRNSALPDTSQNVACAMDSTCCSATDRYLLFPELSWARAGCAGRQSDAGRLHRRKNAVARHSLVQNQPAKSAQVVERPPAFEHVAIER